MASKRYLTWERTKKGKECPICGRADWCVLSKEGPVKCMRAPVDSLTAPAGWHKGKLTKDPHGNLDGGMMFYPDGDTTGRTERQPRSEEQVQKEIAEQIEKDKKNKARARRAWKEGEDQPLGPVESYLEGRGIAIDRLPGKRVPKALRFNANTIDVWDGDGRKWRLCPAMVAAVTGADRQLAGVHRTFIGQEELDEDGKGRWCKRTTGGSKKMLGPVSGGSVRLCTDRSSGVLVLTEGIETGLACLASLTRDDGAGGISSAAAVWACLDAGKLMQVRLGAEYASPGIQSCVHTVVIAADLDKNMVGQQKAAITQNVLTREMPWLTVVVRAPSVEAAPGLVVRKKIEKKGADDDSPVDMPANDAKGVDWLDVYVQCGPEAVRSALLSGLDMDGNRARMLGWGSRTDVSEKRAAGAETTVGEGGAGGGGGVGGGSAGGSDDAPTQRFIDGSPRKRAERFLIEEERVGGTRGRACGLKFWGGKWWEYEGTSYAERDPDVIQSRFWGWLDQFWEVVRGDAEKLDPSERTVKDVMNAAKGLCYVQGDQLPLWLPADFDAEGRPTFAHADARLLSGRPRPMPVNRLVAYKNTLLDLDAWVRGDLVTRDHSPQFFSTSVLPFELPVSDLKRTIDARGDGAVDCDAEMTVMQELLGRVCPTWLDFLGNIAGDDGEWHDALQEWFGYNLIPDNRLEKFLMLVGPPRSGKGTILSALQAMLGERNFASIGLKDLTERFGLAELVGKLSAIVPDAHLSHKTDGTDAVEKLKSITGSDPVRVEGKYERKAITIRLPVRFTIACNELPNLKDSSLALAGRMIVLQTEMSHLGKEDPTLKPRIVAEAEGIMLWALVGLRRLLRKPVMRIVPPRSGVDLLDEIKREQSPVMAFVEDVCVLEPSQETPAEELYRAWVKWTESQHWSSPGSIDSFGRKLRSYDRAIVKTRKRVDNGKLMAKYKGIGLRPFAREQVAHDLQSGGYTGSEPDNLPF